MVSPVVHFKTWTIFLKYFIIIFIIIFLQIAVEAIVNVRTVASLAREKSFYDRFEETLKEPFK